jgi:RNA polymerase sigma factor (sigma-70 family)
VNEAGPPGALTERDGGGVRADEEAFDAFFRRTSKGLLGQAFLLTADTDRAQDLTQEAYTRAWIHWTSIEQYEDPEAWTRRVLHNLCISDWRKRSRRSRVVPGRSTVAPAPNEDHLILLGVLRSLPPNHARALVLHDGLGCTVAEIAAELSVPEGTVKSWISRAKAQASAALREPGPPDREPDRLHREEPRP